MLDLEKQTGIIQNILLELLSSHDDGMSEYDVIQSIKEMILGDDVDDLFRDTHKLFTIHFIIFHNLYLLRQELWETKTGHLVISPLKICILPYTDSDDTQLDEPDPLCEYYLDASNLDNTTQEDVDDMFTHFWSSFLVIGDKESAMEILEIEGTFDSDSLTKQYRKMVMRHHPDRGGDTSRLQEINKALQVLKRCL